MRQILSKLTSLLLCFLTVTTCHGQTTDEYEPFKSSDYATDKYEIKLETVTFSKFKIEIRQAKLRENINNAPSDFYCRGWLRILEGNKIIKQLYFKELEPVGSCYGLFIPHKQPREDYFIITGIDGYDGSIFIIDTTGKVIEKGGGIFSISKDKRYLFSNWWSDLSGLTVYDLNKKLVMFSDTIEPSLEDWYFKEGIYFAEIWHYETDQIDSSKIAVYDFDKNKLIVTSVNKEYLNQGNKLKIYNDVMHEGDCNCGR